MTTYERIIALIKSGRTPIVKDKDGDYTACIYQKNDIIYLSGWNSDINYIYDTNVSTGSKKQCEEDNREIVRIDTPEKITYKEGDLVDLDIEALEKTSDWLAYKEGYGDGKGLIIKNFLNGSNGVYCYIYTKNKNNDYGIGQEYLLPHNPQENKITLSDEELLEELRKRNLLVNKEVVK